MYFWCSVTYRRDLTKTKVVLSAPAVSAAERQRTLRGRPRSQYLTWSYGVGCNRDQKHRLDESDADTSLFYFSAIFVREEVFCCNTYRYNTDPQKKTSRQCSRLIRNLLVDFMFEMKPT